MILSAAVGENVQHVCQGTDYKIYFCARGRHSFFLHLQLKRSSKQKLRNMHKHRKSKLQASTDSRTDEGLDHAIEDWDHPNHIEFIQMRWSDVLGLSMIYSIRL